MKTPSLGTCCGCRTSEGVRTIIMLQWKAALSGRGWGCFQCGAPNDGALVVFCDACAQKVQDGAKVEEVAVDVCRGRPASDGRLAFSSLTEPFGCDLSKHPEAAARTKPGSGKDG